MHYGSIADFILSGFIRSKTFARYSCYTVVRTPEACLLLIVLFNCQPAALLIASNTY